MENLELRMYGLVAYNISPIQQGIQFGHAVVEYGLKYFNTEDYQSWANEYKTFIILNGGTTNDNIERPGTLNIHSAIISEMSIDYAEFYEPDLGDQLTSVVFLVDEKVFNKEKYPDYNGPIITDGLGKSVPLGTNYEMWKKQFNTTSDNVAKILRMREFLKNFRLA